MKKLLSIITLTIASSAYAGDFYREWKEQLDWQEIDRMEAQWRQIENEWRLQELDDQQQEILDRQQEILDEINRRFDFE